MNHTAKVIGQIALVPVAVLTARYAWKAFSPAIADVTPVQSMGQITQERMQALRRRLAGSGAESAAKKMIRHDRKAAAYMKAAETHKWKALQAKLMQGQTTLSEKIAGMRGKQETKAYGRDMHKAAKHTAKAAKHMQKAEARKWQAVGDWFAETGDMLRKRFGGIPATLVAIPAVFNAIPGMVGGIPAAVGAIPAAVGTIPATVAGSAAVTRASKAPRTTWSSYGWGTARAARQARRKRGNMAVGLAAGLGLGAGVYYFIARRRGQREELQPGQESRMFYTGNGNGGTHPTQHAVDNAMRTSESTFDTTTGAWGGTPAREIDLGREAPPRMHEMGMPGETGASMAAEDALSGGEAWIIIPQEQWAEFVQQMSSNHEGWSVSVESEGAGSMDEMPIEDARFEGMRLEPSMARPGVRMHVGNLPSGFFEHVVPDMRTMEHLPADEQGYQALRLTTTIDRVVIRFTDPGDAQDPRAE